MDFKKIIRIKVNKQIVILEVYEAVNPQLVA